MTISKMQQKKREIGKKPFLLLGPVYGWWRAGWRPLNCLLVWLTNGCCWLLWWLILWWLLKLYIYFLGIFCDNSSLIRTRIHGRIIVIHRCVHNRHIITHTHIYACAHAHTHHALFPTNNLMSIFPGEWAVSPRDMSKLNHRLFVSICEWIRVDNLGR